MNVTDHNLKNLVHVVVDNSHSFRARSAKSGHHVLNDLFQIFFRSFGIFKSFLQDFVGLAFASVKVFYLS